MILKQDVKVGEPLFVWTKDKRAKEFKKKESKGGVDVPGAHMQASASGKRLLIDLQRQEVLDN